MLNINNLAEELFAYVESDGNGFRRAARTLQSLWRERSNLPIGIHHGRPLGSRLPADIAERELLNYLTPGIRKVVQETLTAANESQLFSKPRIYNDLLSSQPLCFNLFGELKLDLNLATSTLRMLAPGSIHKVSNILFEYSPGRSADRFTGDRSAFDVFVEYDSINGGRGFLGIEVKYHENLQEPAANHRSKYDEIAARMLCFHEDKLPLLHKAPLQQFWRDHLLAGSMIYDLDLGYTEGKFVVLFPAANLACRSAVHAYRACLSNSTTFDAWTLEEFVGILSLATSDQWVEAFRKRYLDFSQLTISNDLIRARAGNETR